MSNPRLNRKNWDPDQRYYRVANRIVYWDRYTQSWISYNVLDNGDIADDEDGSDYYGHVDHLLAVYPQFKESCNSGPPEIWGPFRENVCLIRCRTDAPSAPNISGLR